MIDTPTLLAYLAACAAIVVMPGPGQALVLARTLAHGRRAGMLTALGLDAGTLGHALAAALGLSALLAASSTAFALVKYAGAAYLVHLGIRAWRTPVERARGETMPPGPGAHAFWRALLVGVLNPKVALFFLAFLPPFVDPHRGPVFAQMLLLGAILAALDLACALVLVLVVDRARGAFPAGSRIGAWRSRITGSVLVALGARLAA